MSAPGEEIALKAQLRFDPLADALYVRFAPVGSSAETEEIADGIIVDRAADGSLVGIEILGVSRRAEDGALDLGEMIVGEPFTLNYGGRSLEIA